MKHIYAASMSAKRNMLLGNGAFRSTTRIYAGIFVGEGSEMAFVITAKDKARQDMPESDGWFDHDAAVVRVSEPTLAEAGYVRNEWRSVANDPPQQYQDVLVFSKSTGWYGVGYMTDQLDWIRKDGEIFIDEPTHWKEITLP
jgi:hypothetical protein